MARPGNKPKNTKQTADIEITNTYKPSPSVIDIAISKLKQKGFPVKEIGGVLFFLYKGPENFELLREAAKKALQDIGYDKSWGVKSVSGNELEIQPTFSVLSDDSINEEEGLEEE